jgi:hypothetical protein
LGDAAARIISVVLFLAALVGFVGATLGLLGWLVPHESWRTLAVVSAVISLIALALFWNAFVSFFPNKVGAIAVNVAVLVGLLWANLPSEADIGFQAETCCVLRTSYSVSIPRNTQYQCQYRRRDPSKPRAGQIAALLIVFNARL